MQHSWHRKPPAWWRRRPTSHRRIPFSCRNCCKPLGSRTTLGEQEFSTSCFDSLAEVGIEPAPESGARIKYKKLPPSDREKTRTKAGAAHRSQLPYPSSFSTQLGLLLVETERTMCPHSGTPCQASSRRGKASRFGPRQAQPFIALNLSARAALQLLFRGARGALEKLHPPFFRAKALRPAAVHWSDKITQRIDRLYTAK